MLLSKIISYIADNMPVSEEHYNQVKRAFEEEIDSRKNSRNIKYCKNEGD